MVTLENIWVELGRFTHRTSNIGKIGAKLNIGELAASVCRCVIVTRWRAFNKLHSPLTMSVAPGCESSTGDRRVKWNGFIIAMVERSAWRDPTRGTAASCLISFIPDGSRMWGGEWTRLAVACGEWRWYVHWSVISSPWRSSHRHRHVYRTLLHLIVSMDHLACPVIDQSMHLTPVRMGLTFAQSFAVIILRSWKLYFPFICECKWTTTTCWLGI